ncbi:putative toxin-antitoxin system toxin component, PIN family [Candidatus Pacearchaeota archaeon]|nr:putative toxin-antitoxin system toxin component, PIN family [Candidatus Pacearchaeota archaeon]
MKLVVDANILFSSLIKEGKTIELLLDPSLQLFTPEYILTEFEKHKDEILKKTNRLIKEFNEIFNFLKTIINIIPEHELSNCLNKANQISPDPNDAMYFALAIKLNCAIWTNDKKLKDQNIIKIYSTSELLEILKIN